MQCTERRTDRQTDEQTHSCFYDIDNFLRSQWIREARIAKYFTNYFPVKLIKTADIDATKGNYLLGSHPHGLLCSGAVAAFASEEAGFSQKFPELTPTLLTLEVFHQIPGKGT